MKILILGGTGAMGVSLVQILAADAKNEIYVTSRSARESSTNVHYIQGNAHQLEFIRRILDNNFDTIIDFMSYSELEFADRYDMFLENTKQYVFLSSARVYAEVEGCITEESIRLLDADIDAEYISKREYALEKAREENLLYQSQKKNWTIIRPYITYNSNRLQLGVLEKEAWLYRAIHGRTIVFSKDISEKYTTLTYGYDVALRIAGVIGNEECYGETYQITTNQAIQWGRVLDIYTKTLEEIIGQKTKVLMLDDTRELINVGANEYQIKFDRLYDRYFNSEKINSIADPKCNYKDVEEGLRHCLQAFMENIEFVKINWKMQAFFDRKANEKTPLTEIKKAKDKIDYIIFRYIPVIGRIIIRAKKILRERV